MKIQRRFTVAGRDPYDGIRFDVRKSEIRNPDGTVVFSLDGVVKVSAIVHKPAAARSSEVQGIAAAATVER